ncbi:hypothetical protein OG946_09185 [Streptomyces sp. NBC_01808]|uniref:hypothetical protein n=1 Tax=Streptomyces sp. NBC_01808 TaxID=2975947 RepID=UPI002DDC4E16|nr:hypothetical protein [Streptomyces sp. NBC_01808]WSA37543.1 hypothetical protein OG946_09185 [Streptomyces sp. NBC_01808]
MTTSDSTDRRPAARPSAARGAAGSVALLALAAVLTGCGSDSDDAKASESATPSRSAEPSPQSPTPTPTPTPTTPPPSPTPVKPLKPSTQAELAACTDGSCTVVVQKGAEIPAVPGLRAGPFQVTGVGAEGVDLTSTDATGFTSSLLGQHPDQGGASTINELSIAVVTITGDTAKLRLFPAE